MTTQKAPHTPERVFWQWFSQNSERVYHFERDQERVFNDLAKRLKAIHTSLTFQIGPIEKGRREFVVSADGIREAFPAVRSLVASAPKLASWKIVAFRQRSKGPLEVVFQGVRLGPDDVWFTAKRIGQELAITLYIRDYAGTDDQNRMGAAFILLDQALGEYDVETKIGGIEWKRLPVSPKAAGLRPLSQLSSVVDASSKPPMPAAKKFRP